MMMDGLKEKIKSYELKSRDVWLVIFLGVIVGLIYTIAGNLGDVVVGVSNINWLTVSTSKTVVAAQVETLDVESWSATGMDLNQQAQRGFDNTIDTFTQFGSFGFEWAGTFWMGYTAMWWLVSIAIVWGWAANIGEENWMVMIGVFVLGAIFMTIGAWGSYQQVLDGYIIPAMFQGIIMIAVVYFNMGKTGLFMMMAVNVFTTLSVWILPYFAGYDFWSGFGYLIIDWSALGGGS